MIHLDDADRHERARNLLLAGMIPILFLPLDHWMIGRWSTTAIAIRIAWAVILITAGYATRHGPSGWLRPAAVLAGASSGIFVGILGQLAGGPGNPLLGWLIAFPFLAALIAPEDTVAVLACGAAAIITAGWIFLRDEGLTLIDAVWLSQIGVAALLSLYACNRYVRQRKAQLKAERERGQAQKELEFSEQRRHDAERLAHTQQLAAIGGMAAGVAHEITNPVCVISGNLELLRDSIASAHPEEMRDMDSAVNQIQNIARDLRTASRQSAASERSCKLAATVEEAVRLTRARWLTHVTLEVELPEGIPEVAISHTRLLQVLVNLIVNACDALESHGGREQRIRISGTFDDSQVHLMVEDNGPGLSEEVTSRMFEAFFTTKDEDKGTGLGLALCRTFIEQADGQIQAGPAGMGGARIALSLPSAAPASELETA